jgi:hypothetical protein
MSLPLSYLDIEGSEPEGDNTTVISITSHDKRKE